MKVGRRWCTIVEVIRLRDSNGNPIAHLHAFHRDPLNFFQSLIRAHGNRVRFRMGLWTFYLLNDPQSVHFVLSHHTRRFRKGPGLEDSNPLIGQGLLTQEGEDWVQQRRRLASVFRRENVEDMVPWLDQVIDEFQSTLVPDQPIDLESTMLQLSLLMVLRTVFGDSQASTPHIAAIGENVQWLMAHFYHRSRSIWRFPYGLPGFNRRYHAHAQKLRQAIHQLVPQPRPFTTVWPNLATPPALRDQEMLTLVIAGYETTGHAMAWALDLLSRHPHVAEATKPRRRALQLILGQIVC
jgi:cytochrome P450